MRPLDVEVIMWAWTHAGKHPRMKARAVKEAFDYWVAFEVLIYDKKSDLYTVTPLGKAFINLILSTPVPKIQYLDPRVNTKVPQ